MSSPGCAVTGGGGQSTQQTWHHPPSRTTLESCLHRPPQRATTYQRKRVHCRWWEQPLQTIPPVQERGPAHCRR
uniref:Uncharacterized protein n=1 Tax=Anguilla anguilla TaxID=7936 RepID=A0A0E9QFI5_ANGAN